MAGTPANVYSNTIVSGAVLVGATSATAPTATTSTTTGFADLGHVGENPVRITPSIEMKEIKDGLTGAIVAMVPTGGKVEISFVLIENSEETAEEWYGQAATLGASGGSIAFKPRETGGRRSWIIDCVNSAGTTFDRYYVAQGEIVSRDEIPVGVGEQPRYAMTIIAYEVSGVAFTKFSTVLTS